MHAVGKSKDSWMPIGSIGWWAGSVFFVSILLIAALWTVVRSPGFNRWRRRRRARFRFRRACRSGDPVAAWAALRDWAGACIAVDTVPGPGSLARRLNGTRAAAALWALDARLYRGGADNWNGVEAAQAILPALRDRKPIPPPRASALPDLNP